MKTLPYLACSLLLLAVSPSSALDLTPHFPPKIANTPIRWLHFVDGDNRYVLEVPLGVEMSAADGGTLFRFRDIEDAFFSIRNSPLIPDTSFSNPTIEAYRKAALAFAPAGATDVATKEEASTTVPIANSTSYRFVVSYKIPGRSFQMAITFTNVNAQQQIVLMTFAPSDKFNSAAVISSQILSSWHMAKPGENLSDPPTS